ncbi:MAG: PEP-CTERM sorting domain-containing protein [Candidatus Omnitrophica bacterium]|nr:PEP-CTERM sorting domain-containing protein [Candidatus Omnitrophota bacterium]MDD5670503.1 PEP-CTERM sorting domain-containing protein [Candidatus Omnitrophota bacterium]
MKRGLGTLILAMTFCSPIATASVVAFDDLASGIYGDTLIYGDVTFKSQAGGKLEVTNQSADGFGNAHSLPNKLSVWGDPPLTPKEKTSILIFFNHTVQSVDFWLTGTFHDTTVNAYDKNGDLIDTFLQTFPLSGPVAPDGNPWDYYYDHVLNLIRLQGAAISKVTIQPSAYDGFSIDDLAYAAIPEPSTVLLMIWGLLGLSFVKMKK